MPRRAVVALAAMSVTLQSFLDGSDNVALMFVSSAVSVAGLPVYRQALAAMRVALLPLASWFTVCNFLAQAEVHTLMGTGLNASRGT